MKHIFHIILAFLAFIQCSKKTSENQESSVSIPLESDSLRMDDEFVDEPISLNSNQALYDIHWIERQDLCDYELACDCCSGNLLLTDSIFYWFNYCVGSTNLKSGHYTYNDDSIVLRFRPYMGSREYNHEAEIDTSLYGYYFTSTFTNAGQSRFNKSICNDSIELYIHDGKGASVLKGSELAVDVFQSNPGIQGLIDYYNKVKDFSYNVTTMDSLAYPNCNCVYSTTWEALDSAKYIYQSDFEFMETFSIDGKTITHDIRNREQNQYKISEVVFRKSVSQEGVTQKSGYLIFSNQDGFSIEIDFVGQCGC